MGIHAPAGETLTEAEFRLKGWPAWVRVEVCDVQDRWAWSNPLFLTEKGGEDRNQTVQP